MVKCLICSEFEEARRYAGNIKCTWLMVFVCDGKKKLQDIVDHLHGASHASGLEMKKLSIQWSNNSMNHPWLWTLKSNDPNAIQTLIHMAVDVYNDSKLLTPAAWSWPLRSLAQIHAHVCSSRFYGNTDHGDAAFSQFQPSEIDLHCHDSVHYAENVAYRRRHGKSKV